MCHSHFSDTEATQHCQNHAFLQGRPNYIKLKSGNPEGEYAKSRTLPIFLIQSVLPHPPPQTQTYIRKETYEYIVLNDIARIVPQRMLPGTDQSCPVR